VLMRTVSPALSLRIPLTVEYHKIAEPLVFIELKPVYTLVPFTTILVVVVATPKKVN
jgi:hypothetical protein